MCIRDSNRWGKNSREIFALRHYVYKEMMMMMITSQSSLQNYLLLPPELSSNHSPTARSHLLAMAPINLGPRSIEIKNLSADKFKKFFTSMSCIPESATQTCDTSKRIGFLTAVNCRPQHGCQIPLLNELTPSY